MSRAQCIVQAFVCLLAATSWSCAHGETCGGLACGSTVTLASGTLRAKPGSGVSGEVTLVENFDVVKVTVEVHGAEPGLHGIHIHEKGDCSAPDFSSAGGHFNPTGAPHACPPTEPRHAGDLGNIEIGADGSGRIEVTTDLITVSPGDRSVVGRALIVHRDADDCTSQPAGESGMREACAVIMVK
jgi:Cu-Zn family superoxide dismutase